MQQLKVSLPDEMRARLDAAASAAGHTLGEEIRLCIQRAYSWEQFDAPTQVLMHLIGRLAAVTEVQTGRTWWHDPAAYYVFRSAAAILLGRRKPEGELVSLELDPAELPANRPVAVTDLNQMAAGLEAIVSMDRALSADDQLELLKRAEQTRQGGQGVKRLFEKMGFETPPPPTRSRVRKPKGE
jgi:hypothetical protein